VTNRTLAATALTGADDDSFAASSAVASPDRLPSPTSSPWRTVRWRLSDRPYPRLFRTCGRLGPAFTDSHARQARPPRSRSPALARPWFFTAERWRTDLAWSYEAPRDALCVFTDGFYAEVGSRTCASPPSSPIELSPAADSCVSGLRFRRPSRPSVERMRPFRNALFFRGPALSCLGRRMPTCVSPV
jgi:hypothetical protein